MTLDLLLYPDPNHLFTVPGDTINLSCDWKYYVCCANFQCGVFSRHDNKKVARAWNTGRGLNIEQPALCNEDKITHVHVCTHSRINVHTTPPGK